MNWWRSILCSTCGERGAKEARLEMEYVAVEGAWCDPCAARMIRERVEYHYQNEFLRKARVPRLVPIVRKKESNPFWELLMGRL